MMLSLTADDALSDGGVLKCFALSLSHSLTHAWIITWSHSALLCSISLRWQNVKRLGERRLTGCSTDRCDGTERNEREDLALFLYQYSTVGTMYEKVPILIPRICSIMRWTITSQSERTNELFLEHSFFHLNILNPFFQISRGAPTHILNYLFIHWEYISRWMLLHHTFFFFLVVRASLAHVYKLTWKGFDKILNQIPIFPATLDRVEVVSCQYIW